MEKGVKFNDLESEIEKVAKKFIEKSNEKEIYVVSHFDTDGITSATIIIQTLKKLDKKFSVKIIKRLEKKFIYELPKDKLILFLDLASGSLPHIENSGLEDIFIIDHHEIIHEIPKKIHIINSELTGNQKMSSSCLAYLFCKQIIPESKELEKLAVLGMIGDCMEESINKINNKILNDGEIKRKRGLLIYPSTRPLNRTLEYCSNPYIPGVTGNSEGVLELLREVGLNSEKGKYKSLIELTEEEMSKLVTSIMLRNPKSRNRKIVGDIFLIKFFNKLEDARELSAIINACSRLERSDIAIQFCMEISRAKKEAESIHIKYKQVIISGLKFVSETEKIEGSGFVIINAKNNVKDTIVGTIASILSNSAIYEEGTIIITMAYYDDKIKVSSRCVGKNTRNLREILTKVIEKIGGEVGGHEFAAGCMIKQKKEQEFIELLQKNLEIELVKI
ncbi:DHH family phosphoesterase [Candidatus Pacearchaeota archaeon]|nr:DHH family phosphoesterase [Candidatus Pacearchaeota archaeon]